jgi:N-acyl-D-amino-acid deacylase
VTVQGGPTVDVLIRGGTVVDGTGATPRRADVIVAAGRIAAVAQPWESGSVSAALEVDATGQVVCPGFIDLHSHADFSILGHPAADTALTQGVTTLLTGNCGWSPFPLTDTETLPRATAFLDPECGAWSWTDAAGYAAVVQEARPAVNVALQVGHSALRLAVLGTDERTPTTTELQQMCALLATAAEQGVHGFSTGLIYAPGCYAEATEVTALVRVAAENDLLYSTHMRNEADQLLPAVAEALGTAAAAGARLEISHLKAMGRPNQGRVAEALQSIDEAAGEGLDVGCDMYPYTASSTTLTSRLPAWALNGGVTALLHRLADSTTRTQIAAELRQRMTTDVDPDGVVVAALPEGPYSDTIGSSLTEIGARFDIRPEEAALRLLEDHQAAVAVVNHAMAEDDVVTVIRHPRASVASDGWTMRPDGTGAPHPRSFGSFTRVLGRYVRDRDELTLAEAIAKMTSHPAARGGLHDRGVLRPGAVADIAVFDADLITDRSTFTNPWQLSVGVSAVLVAGQPALINGQLTGHRAGAVLRKG